MGWKTEIGVLPLKDAVFVDLYDTGASQIKIAGTNKVIHLLHDTDFGPDTFHKNTAKSHKHPGIRPRWGRVIATNPTSAKTVKIGDKILIDTLEWSHACPIPGYPERKFYRVETKKILLIDPDGFTKEEMKMIKERQNGAWIK